MTFGKVLAAGAVLVVVVAIVERYDERMAMLLAVVTILALLFKNRRAMGEIIGLLQGRPSSGGGGSVQ